MENPTFTKHVFEVIADGLIANRKLQHVLATGKSFEQWINMEAFLACNAAGLNAEPEWRYDKYNRSDLHVQSASGRSKVLVEIKLVGDYTQRKYLNSIKSDHTRLASLVEKFGGTAGLQIIVMSSTGEDIITRDDWIAWIGPDSQYTPWNIPTEMKKSRFFRKNGCVHIWGWPISKPAAAVRNSLPAGQQKRSVRTKAFS